MIPLVDLLNTILPLLHALAAVNYAIYFVRDDPFSARTATPFLRIVLGVHAVYLALRALAFHHHPMATLFEVLTVVAFAVGLVYLYVEAVQRNKATGLFILPLAFLAQTISSAWIGHTETVNPLFHSKLFGLHTGLAALGTCAFLVSAAYAVMYLLLYRALKAGAFGLLFERLPSLDALAKMTVRAAGFGVAGLAAAIAVGLAWGSGGEVPGFRWTDGKALLSFAALGIYVLALLGHLRWQWREGRVVGLSLAGFGLHLLSIAAPAWLLPSFHSFAT